jgi:predicted Rossmann-fold nucleotide-binding protein
MRERKHIMEDKADAFVIAPGGIGTFEEFFEVLTLKQLARHKKPIIFYDIYGYYNKLMDFMEYAAKERFIRENCKFLYQCTDDDAELIEYLENTNLSISEISRNVAFNSENHFRKIFSDFTGTTPLKYRKNSGSI